MSRLRSHATDRSDRTIASARPGDAERVVEHELIGTLSSDGTVALALTEPSPDGNLLLYGIAASGRIGRSSKSEV